MFQATYILNLLVMNLSDLQSNIVCVERIKEYTDIDEEVFIKWAFSKIYRKYWLWSFRFHQQII